MLKSEWGNPKKRDPELIRRDVMNGVVSIKSAEKDFGLSLNDVTYLDTDTTIISDSLPTSTSRTILKTDFWAIGRTVEKLGINPKWSVDELNKFLEVRYYLIFKFLLKEKLHYLVAPFLFLYFFTLQPLLSFYLLLQPFS